MNHLSWNVTKRCNLYCSHCYRESGPDVDTASELSTAEGKKLLREAKRAGFNIIVFSGGEPLMRDDIFELIESARSLEMTPLMGSNGTLVNKDAATRLAGAGLQAIAISLDSLDPSIHDSFRRVEGSFARSLEGIRNCIDAGIRVQINPTLTKHNFREAGDMIDFATQVGAASCHLLFLVEVGRGREIAIDSLSKKEYKETIGRILEKQTSILAKPTCAPQYMVEALHNGIEVRSTRGCIAGISYCSVLPNGDVHICPYTPVKVASVREAAFDDIWANNEVFKQLRDYKQYKGKCGSCRYVNICGGCRARALSSTGDWLGEDPMCLLEA